MSDALAFLRWAQPGEPWTLTAIARDRKGIETRTFATEPEAQAFLDAHAAADLYWSPNPLLRPASKKPTKAEVAEGKWLWVDLDPPKGEDPAAFRARVLAAKLPPGVPPPTCTVNSGRGIWLLWRLAKAEPLGGDAARIAEFERYGRQLELLYAGADSCRNVDRIARLPGTVNRKTGETACVIGEFGPDASIGQFVPAPEEGAGPAEKVAVKPERVADVQADPRLQGLSPLCKVAIVQGCDPDDPGRWRSRSEALHYVCCEMVRAGVADEVILGILSDSRHGISASVLDKGRGADRYALRQVERARSAAADFFLDQFGAPHRSIRNIEVAIAKLGVVLEYDEFANQAMIQALPGFGPHLDDGAVNRMWVTAAKQYRLQVAKDTFWTVVLDQAQRGRRHPVREYLDSLRWDGEPRVDRWLSEYMGAEDTEYVRAVGALVLVAAVRRVRQPGCKFDEMLVLEGAQGTQKSSALAALAVRADWFSDDLPLNARAQEFIEATTGRWIVEAGELKGMRKGDVESLKSGLSRSVDRARMAYGRLPLERPRQFVIVGTTNSDRYLRDNTGNRRFWPVQTDEVRLRELVADRDQLWAEASAREAKGESIRLDPALWPAAAEQQDDRRVEDPWVEKLRGILGAREGRLLSDEVFSLLGIHDAHRTQDQNQRIGDAMRELGWERKRLRLDGEMRYHYVRGDEDRRLRVEFDCGTWRVALPE